MVATAVIGSAVAGVAGGVMQAGAASDAAGQQAQAATQAASDQSQASLQAAQLQSQTALQAAQMQQATAQQAMAQQNAMFQQVRGSLAPTIGMQDQGASMLAQWEAIHGFDYTGVPANQLASRILNPNAFVANQQSLALNPNSVPIYQNFNPSDLTQTPGYQFALQQGLESTQNGYAAQGLGTSGAAMKGAANYAQGLASQTYQQQLQNNMAQQAQRFGQQLGAQAQGFGQSLQAQGQYYNEGLGANQQAFNQQLANQQQDQQIFQLQQGEKQRLFGDATTLMGLGSNAAAGVGQMGLNSQAQSNNLLMGSAQAGAAGMINAANASAGGIVGAAQAGAAGLIGAGQAGAAGTMGTANALSGMFGNIGNSLMMYPMLMNSGMFGASGAAAPQFSGGGAIGGVY